MTAADIARLRGLLAAATPGPWEWDREAGEITGYRGAERWLCGGVWNGDDGEAMVAAVNSLPSLLDAIEAERARAEKAENELAQITGLWHRERDRADDLAKARPVCVVRMPQCYTFDNDFGEGDRPDLYVLRHEITDAIIAAGGECV